MSTTAATSPKKCSTPCGTPGSRSHSREGMPIVRNKKGRDRWPPIARVANGTAHDSPRPTGDSSSPSRARCCSARLRSPSEPTDAGTITVDITPSAAVQLVRSQRSARRRHRPVECDGGRKAVHEAGNRPGALGRMADRVLPPEHRVVRRSVALESGRHVERSRPARAISPGAHPSATRSSIRTDTSCRIVA